MSSMRAERRYDAWAIAHVRYVMMYGQIAQTRYVMLHGQSTHARNTTIGRY